MGTSFGMLARALALACSGILLSALVTPVQAVDGLARIDRIGPIARYTSSSTMKFEVTYQCTDVPPPAGVVHWITATVQQPDKAGYSMGFRNDSAINFTQARCTGAPVTQTLTVARSGNVSPAVPDPSTGPAEISVRLEQYATKDMGGTLSHVGLGAELTSPITVACNARYDNRCHPPRPVATRISFVSRSIVYASPTTMRTRLSYTCQNLPGPVGVVHYLLVGLRPGSGAHYSSGYRGEGGTVKARCTGRKVHVSVTLKRYDFPSDARNPRPGVRHLEVSLSPRLTPDSGGWYVSAGPDADAQVTTRLRCRSGYVWRSDQLHGVCRPRR